MKNLLILGGLAIVVSISIIGYLAQSGQQPTASPSAPAELPLWMTTTFKDVTTGNDFVISELDGPVLVETFAVWCPACKRQQERLNELHDELGDSFTSVSLDTDPNEDESQVIQHAQRNGFGWAFAVSPGDVTQSLVDQFGIAVVSAPSVPIIMVCEDHSTRFLRSGLKSVNDLKDALEEGCAA